MSEREKRRNFDALLDFQVLFIRLFIYLFIVWKLPSLNAEVLLLFPVDRDTHEVFWRFESNVFGWTSRNTKKSGAFQCITLLVWNKFTALLRRPPKEIRWVQQSTGESSIVARNILVPKALFASLSRRRLRQAKRALGTWMSPKKIKWLV